MADDPRKRGADVEIYEETDTNLPVTRPRFIRINGVDIGYTSLSGIEIEANSSTGLSVTLTIQPRSITIHQVRPDQSVKESTSTKDSAPRNPGLTTDPGPITINGHEAIKNAVQIRENGHHNHSHIAHD